MPPVTPHATAQAAKPIQPHNSWTHQALANKQCIEYLRRPS